MMLKQDNVYGAATCASRDNELSNVNELPPHLVKLPQGRWALWRCMGLRGAGFPISELAKISTPVCAHAADVVLTRENEVRQARSEAIAALMGMLEPGERYHKGAMRKVLRRVRQRQPLDLDDKLASVPALAEFNRAVAQLDTALANYREAFKQDNSRLSEGIRSSASAGRFREAVIWQNHPAFHNTIQSLLAEPSDAEKGWKQKRREEVVASYLQRYCTKNDTIGFFGPVGWANFVDRDELVTVQAGPGLIASRQVYFEGWCIDALAQEFSAQKGVRPYLAPRLRPSVRCEGTTLRLPFGGQLKIAPDHAAILQACDGTRSAKQIAEDLIADPFTSFRDEQSIYSVLDFLFSRKLIFWGFHTPVEAHPELTLRRYLEQIGDSKVRESSLAILDEVIAARNAVSAACGFAEELDRAMTNLNEIFTRFTNSAATRSKHHTYARALVYEDCRRDIKLEIGNGLLQELAPPLHLALKSARWLTAQAFEICRVYFKTIFQRLAVANQEHRVDIASFWMEIQQLAQEERGPQHDLLIGDFQERWSRVMAIPEEQRQVQYSTAELQQKVNEQFYTADDVAKYVRYHSPDLMIAAKSAEALRRGEYRFVLGELHAAVNTLSYLLFLEQHPAPEEFASAWNADIPECRVLPVLPKTFFGGAMRTKLLAVTPRDFFLDFANDSPDPNPRAVPFAEFFIEESGDGLVVRSFDGRFEFDVMQFFAMAVIAMVTNCFKIANRERHVPRVSIDRLVVCRESWSFVTSELEFANESDEAARFLAIRRWAKGHEMPRHVFVTSPCERKPFYVDFDSIIYVDLFAKVVRRTARENPNDRVVITEMLPGPEDLWLPDAEDNRYTSEFRIVALDLAGWTNPNSQQQPQMSELAIN